LNDLNDAEAYKHETGIYESGRCADTCPEGTLKVYNIKSDTVCGETCISPNLYYLYSWS